MKQFFILITALFIILSQVPAQAVQIKKIERFELEVPADQTETRTALNVPFDPDRTVLIPGQTTPVLRESELRARERFTGGEGAGLVAVELLGNNTLRTSRLRSDLPSAVTPKATPHLAQFDSSVRVLRGVTRFGPDTKIKKINVPTFNVAKSFPLLQVTSETWFNDESASTKFMATFPNDSTLQLERSDFTYGKFGYEHTPAAVVEVHWQIVEFLKDAKVTSGTTRIKHYATQDHVDLKPGTISDYRKTFLVFNYAAADETFGVEGFIETSGMILNEGSLRFTRALKGERKGHVIDVAWYLIELTDPTSYVQKGTTFLGEFEDTLEIEIAPIDPKRSVVFASASGGLEVVHEKTKDLLHNFKIASEIVNSKTLRFTRDQTQIGTPVEIVIEWFVVEFSPLTLIEPDGGEVWKSGERHDILWNYADSLLRGGRGEDGMHLLDIYLSLDNGKDNYPLQVATNLDAGSGRYSWLIPETIMGYGLIGNHLRIRIVDKDLERRNYDNSSGPFAIKGSLKLLQPEGGETWVVGETKPTIEWSFKGKLGTVALYYDDNSGLSIDSFSEDMLIAKKVHVGEDGIGRFVWDPIADIHSDRVRIQVVSNLDPTLSDATFRDLTIEPISLSIQTETMELDKWIAESTVELLFETNGPVPTYNVYYSIDQGDNWIAVAEGLEGGPKGRYQYAWRVPSDLVKEKVHLKIEKADDAKVFDIIPRIEEGVPVIQNIVFLQDDTPGRVLRVTETFPIRWKVQKNVERVKLAYTTDGGETWERIGNFPASDGVMIWRVPDDPADEVLIRVQSEEFPDYMDITNTPIAIKGTLRFLSPEEGEVLTAGESKLLTWEKKGVPDAVELHYSTDGGKTYPEENLIVKDVSDTRYFWKPIPDQIGDSIKLRVRSTRDPELVQAESEGLLTIRGVLTLLRPLPDSIWPAETLQTISWSVQGHVGEIKIEHSSDGGLNWKPLKKVWPSRSGGEGLMGEGSFEWKVPPIEGADNRIRIWAIESPETFDEMTVGFKIKDFNLVLTYPNGGEELVAGDRINIKWKASDIETLEILLSEDGGQTYNKTIAFLVSAGGLGYFWEIPEDLKGSAFKLKLVDSHDPEASDESDATFAIL